MKIILFAIFLLSMQAVVAQQVHLITADNLNNRINKGQDTTFVINFWATWCVPCIKELPGFEKFNQKFKDEKLKVLLITPDFKSDLTSSVVPFIKKRNIKSEVLLLDEKDQQVFINKIDSSWSGTIPATLFIKNSNRKFFEKNFTFDELLKEYHQFN